MEQIFEQMNLVMQRNYKARQRFLNVRTYKVVPLANRSGVIEWVADTMPLHAYSFPAHEKYNQEDWKPN